MKIYKDFKAYNNNSRIPKALLNISFYININYRISTFFSRIKLLFIAKIFWLINRIVFSIDIDPRAKIGGGFKIIHGLGIVIGAYAIIGDNFRIYQGVTIGGNMGKTREYKNLLLHQPYIGDNVIISANAVVLGPLVLHDNCIVGACSVITKDVDQGCVVVGNNKILNNKKN